MCRLTQNTVVLLLRADHIRIYLVVLLFKDKRLTRQYGYSARGTRPVVRDYSYARVQKSSNCPIDGFRTNK